MPALRRSGFVARKNWHIVLYSAVHGETTRRGNMRKGPAVLAALAVLLTALAVFVAIAAGGTSLATAHGFTLRPAISDWQYLGNSGVPPSQAACNAVGRRCFNPTSMANSYNYAVLHALGNEG